MRGKRGEAAKKADQEQTVMRLKCKEEEYRSNKPGNTLGHHNDMTLAQWAF